MAPDAAVDRQPVRPVDLGQARDAFRDMSGRAVELVRNLREPQSAAVGNWKALDVARHLSHSHWALPQFARGTEHLFDDVWDLEQMTDALLRDDVERDPAAIAERLAAGAVDMLDVTASATGEERRQWMVKDVKLPMSALVCHLLNELLVHGRDIAEADRRPWTIPPAYANLVIQGFIIQGFQAMPPRTMVDQKTAAGLRATYDLRFRKGGCQAYFSFDDGSLVIESPSDRRVDCHISADPVAFLLVAWGRKSQWGPIARGQLVAWGRKPWLGPKFRKLMRNP